MKISRPILIALFIITAVILTYFFVMPAYNEFKKNQEELSYKKAEYIAKRDYYADITNLHYALLARKDDIKKIDDALPTGSNFGQLLYFLQKQASESGLVMKGISISQTSLSSAKKSGGDVSFSVNLLGFYSAMESFISSLERSSKIFEITGISFGAYAPSATTSTTTSTPTNSENQSSGDGPRSFTLQIKTHSY